MGLIHIEQTIDEVTNQTISETDISHQQQVGVNSREEIVPVMMTNSSGTDINAGESNQEALGGVEKIPPTSMSDNSLVDQDMGTARVTVTKEHIKPVTVAPTTAAVSPKVGGNTGKKRKASTEKGPKKPKKKAAGPKAVSFPGGNRRIENSDALRCSNHYGWEVDSRI